MATIGDSFMYDDEEIPGCTFGYAFDDIPLRSASYAGQVGNRKSATSDLTGTATYDPNTLNQYESRTVPGIIPVIGTAAADTVVKIHRKALGNGPAAFIVPDRTGDRFHKNIPVDNSNGPVTEELDVYCHKHLTDPDREIAAKVSRTVTVPGSPEEFTHDPDGNLLSDGLWTYTWDAENRLTSVESVSSVSNKTRIEFTYDFQSRRTAKKTYAWDTDHWSLITDHRFAYDGWNLVATFNAANELQQSFLWGEDLSGSLQGAGGVGGLLAVSDATDTYLPAYDGNGNIMAYVDAADGTTAATFEYDPFGRTIAATGTAPCAFRFSTKPLDAETRLYYYGHRYYNADMGRWPSRDPMGEHGGPNRYTFVGNSPIDSVDILGLFTPAVHLRLSISAARSRLNDQIYSGMLSSRGAKDNFMELLGRGSIYPDLPYVGTSGAVAPTEYIYQGDRVLESIDDILLDPLREAGWETARWAARHSMPRWAYATARAARNWWQDSSYLKQGVDVASMLYPELQNNALYQSHFGANMWMHGMGTSGSAQALKDAIVNSTVALLVEYRKAPCNGFPLGQALHYLQDTRTPSHTQWSGSAIARFQDYNLQSPTLHKMADMNPTGQATTDTATLFKIANDLSIDESALRDRVEMLYPLDPKAEVGGTAAQFSPRPWW